MLLLEMGLSLQSSGLSTPDDPSVLSITGLATVPVFNDVDFLYDRILGVDTFDVSPTFGDLAFARGYVLGIDTLNTPPTFNDISLGGGLVLSVDTLDVAPTLNDISLNRGYDLDVALMDVAPTLNDIAFQRGYVLGVATMDAAPTFNDITFVYDTGVSTAGVRSVSGIDVIADWQPTLTESVASTGTETIAEVGGETAYDLWNGSDSGASNNMSFNGTVGTSTSYYDVSADDWALSKNLGSNLPARYLSAFRSDQAAGTYTTIYFAFRIGFFDTGSAALGFMSWTGGNKGIFITGVSGGSFGVNIYGSGTTSFSLSGYSNNTDFLMAIQLNNNTGEIKYAVNADTWTTHGSTHTLTSDLSSSTSAGGAQVGMFTGFGIGMDNVNHRWYGTTLVNGEQSDADLAAVRDWYQTNTPLP